MAGRKKERWVGFDLGGTKMMAQVFDARFKPLGSRRRKTKGHLSTAQGLRRICETISLALEDAGLAPAQLSGIGVGSPGPLDMARGILPEAPNLSWRKVRLKTRLAKVFGCPVAVMNDVDAGVYGEYRFGAARRARCAVGIFPGTGIGGGAVYKGKIVSGKSLSAMEIGHLPVLPGGPRCGCGQYGCLEAMASRLAISGAAAAAAYRGDAPHLMELAGTDLSQIRSGALAASIKAGDAAVERIVRDAARWLGVGTAMLVNLLVPDVVILGGGLVEEMPELYREEVEAAARERTMPAFRDSFDLRVAALGDDAAVLGAAAWAQQAAGKGAT